MTCQREKKDGKAGRTKHKVVALLWHFCCSSCSTLPDNTGPAVKSPEGALPAHVGTSIPILPILKAEVFPHQLTSFPGSSALVGIRGTGMTTTPQCVVSQSLQFLRQPDALWD